MEGVFASLDIVKEDRQISEEQPPHRNTWIQNQQQQIPVL